MYTGCQVTVKKNLDKEEFLFLRIHSLVEDLET